MINKLKIVSTFIILILLLASCNETVNNTTKEKELADKEKELMAKENALLSKENELLNKELQAKTNQTGNTPMEENGNFYCSPLIYNPKVLSKPDSNSIHPDWKDSEVGTSWSIVATKKITNDNGIFLYGDLYSPRGGKMENGPFYFIYTEWSCSK